jgi:type IV pilus assembly protein PilW
MSMTSASKAARTGQRGFGLVEVMIGLVIGLIAVLVIYQVYTVAEGFKRNTTASGESQQTGLFSTFVLGMEVGNAGAGMADAAQDLAACTDPGNFSASFRPIPVMITDGGGGVVNPNPDSFVVNYSMATTLANSATFAADALPAGSYTVQSPGGFHTGDLIVAIQAPGGVGSPCASSVITAPPTVPDLNGFVTITHTGTAINLFAGASRLLNMGPCSKMQKVQYNLNGNVLQSTQLLDTGANCVPAVIAPNPLASNIVMMKAEYGVADPADPKGLLNTWVQANVGGGWDPASLLPAAGSKINLIKAIRIGFIVQSEQFDRDRGDYPWVLFDCADPIKANCPGRLTGTIAASLSPPGNWRYRTYETVIPLRNEIWNKQ